MNYYHKRGAVFYRWPLLFKSYYEGQKTINNISVSIAMLNLLVRAKHSKQLCFKKR